MSILSIAGAQIFGPYHWAEYKGVLVVVDTDSELIGALSPQLVAEWRALESTKRLVGEMLKYNLYSDLSDFFQEVSTGPSEIQGFYMYPLLFPHYMSWVDPAFAIRISTVVHTHVISYGPARVEKLRRIVELEKNIAGQSAELEKLRRETRV